MSFVRVLVNALVLAVMAVGLGLQALAAACYMRGDE